MMLRVKKVVGSILSSNMYILFEESSSDCWIVDIGDFCALKKTLPAFACVKGLFLTHGHFDHIAGVNDFHKMFPEAVIYTSKYGKEQLYSDRKNFSYYHGKSVKFEGEESSIYLLSDGDEIVLFKNAVLKILATPGHCPSCLSFFTSQNLFTGDSFIPGAKLVSRLPGGNKIQAKKSLERILQLSQNRTIYAGHDIDNWNSLL